MVGSGDNAKDRIAWVACRILPQHPLQDFASTTSVVAPDLGATVPQTVQPGIGIDVDRACTLPDDLRLANDFHCLQRKRPVASELDLDRCRRLKLHSV
jgi:hypothetical protein